MSKRFTKADAEKIGKVLAADSVSEEKDRFRMRLINLDEHRHLDLEVFPHEMMGKDEGMMLVVYTGNSHLQLHNCTGYVLSEELGEVTFVAETNERLSGLVVERGASCSLYAALDRELISSDFTQLGVEVMLSGVALSLAEDILSAENSDDDTTE
jgi:hypothetical protein